MIVGTPWMIAISLAVNLGPVAVIVGQSPQARCNQTGHSLSFIAIRAADDCGSLQLQIEQHLTLALETGYQASEKPVGEAIVDSVLSKQIDDLEPTLTRHGYTTKVLCEMLGTKPGEIKALFNQTLETDRTRELKEQMLAAGLPV